MKLDIMFKVKCFQVSSLGLTNSGLGLVSTACRRSLNLQSVTDAKISTTSLVKVNIQTHWTGSAIKTLFPAKPLSLESKLTLSVRADGASNCAQ